MSLLELRRSVLEAVLGDGLSVVTNNARLEVGGLRLSVPMLAASSATFSILVP